MSPEARTGLARRVARYPLALFMVGVGVMHFTSPDFFVRIVPDVLPAHAALVAISGVFEIAGGIGLLVAPMRRAASLGLVALYVAVFPANVNMVVHPELGGSVPAWVLWVRLPLQAAFIAWALWAGRDLTTTRGAPRSAGPGRSTSPSGEGPPPSGSAPRAPDRT